MKAAAILFLLAVAVYFNGLRNDFTQDDFYYIVDNPDIQQAPWQVWARPYGGIHHLFRGSLAGYRPLTTMSYAANYALGDLEPVGYHLLNLLLHATVTVLFYVLVRKLLDRPGAALAAALLFAVHPIHTEAVTAAVGRGELLALGFVLGAWLLHLGGRFWWAVFCFWLALLSKESAAAFLALAPLGDFVSRRWRPPHVYARYAGVLGLFLLLRWKVLGAMLARQIPLLDNPLAALPPAWRLLNALRVAWKYLALQLFPVRLSADYSFNALPVTRSWTDLLPALLATAAVLAAWFWSSGRHRAVFLAGGIYLAGFALTANVLFPIGSILAERQTYGPSLGLCLLAGMGWEWLAARRQAAAVVLLTLVVAALGARTVLRNRDWRDDFTLFQAAVEAVPGSAKAHHNLGVEYLRRRQWEQARAHFDIAYRIYPDYPALLGSLGLLYLQLGDRPRALKFMEGAVERAGPDNLQYNELANTYAAVLIGAGRYQDALAVLDHIIAVAPQSTGAYLNRALAHYYRQEWEAARADVGAALRLDPENDRARSLLIRLNRPPGR